MREVTVAIFVAAFSMGAHAAGKDGSPLPAPIQAKVGPLSQAGDAFVKQAKYREAAEKYVAALELLPQPWTQWQACAKLLGGIGDANFRGKHYEHAKVALIDAMQCPGVVGTPSMHLRLGQANFELGERKHAADELTRAYMGGGKEIFAAEDPKYFEYLKTVIKPPANGKW